MSEAQIRLRAGVVTQLIDGEMLLLDTRGGSYYDLNRSGSLMLQRLLEGASREQTVAAVQAHFRAPGAQVAADLEALLQALTKAGLVELGENGDAQRAPA